MPPETLYAVAAGGICLFLVLLLVLVRRRRKRRAPGPAAPPPAPWTVLLDNLAPTRQGFLTRLQGAWGAGADVDARLAAIEEMLLIADVGLTATHGLLAKLRPRASDLRDVDALREALRDEMRAVLTNGGDTEAATAPHVILGAGVKGVGKTTTIGKLAHRHRQAGKKVLLVAADTFRAAASEQLERWARRVDVPCVRHQSGADPSAVVFDGLKAAVARNVDVVIVDTAGRLHVKANLVEELKKIVRVIGRQIPDAPHEVLLVIDATTGQNAISQARVFCQALPVTGIVLTKLDGTAKGGA